MIISIQLTIFIKLIKKLKSESIIIIRMLKIKNKEKQFKYSNIFLELIIH